jgi:hypothetical protein
LQEGESFVALKITGSAIQPGSCGDGTQFSVLKNNEVLYTVKTDPRAPAPDQDTPAAEPTEHLFNLEVQAEPNSTIDFVVEASGATHFCDTVQSVVEIKTDSSN